MHSYSIFNTRSATDSAAPIQTGYLNPPVATIYSDIWAGTHRDGYGLHIAYTGTLTGTLTLWMSDKPFPSVADDTDWVQDTAFSPTNPAGAAGKFRDDTGNAKSMHKRLKYVGASGAGTLFGWVSLPRTA